MTVKEKRAKIEEMVLGTMSRMDKTGINTDKYKKFFKSMNDEEFSKWVNKFLKNDNMNYYMEFLPHKNEPKLQDLYDAGKYINVPLDEYIYYRQDGNKDNPIRSPYKVPVGYLMIRRLQQMLFKKNSYNLNIDGRNPKTNQLNSSSKVARITDQENFALSIYGADASLQEFFGPRADDGVAKLEMYKEIAQQGYTQLQNYTNDVKNKQTLNTIDVFFMGAGIMTDLVTDDLELIRTKEERKRRKSTAEKNDI